MYPPFLFARHAGQTKKGRVISDPTFDNLEIWENLFFLTSNP
jgi:hypothetical protein